MPEGLCALAGLEVLNLVACGLTALPEEIGALAGLRRLFLGGNGGLIALPAGLGRLRNLGALGLFGCPRLADLYNLQSRDGLPALLAHLAAQGEPAAAGGQL